MGKKPQKVEGGRPQKEAEERRDEIIKRLLNTPPKPHKTKAVPKRDAKRGKA